MGSLQIKKEGRRVFTRDIVKKKTDAGRIITIMGLGKFHEYRLHATKGWRIKKVRFIPNPNIILFNDHKIGA